MVLTAMAVGPLLFLWTVMPETKRRIGRFAVWPFLIEGSGSLAKLAAETNRANPALSPITISLDGAL
jgi:hypothetical protein